MVQPDRAQMTIRRIHFACWMYRPQTNIKTHRMYNNCFLFHGNELNEQKFDDSCYCKSITTKKVSALCVFKGIIKCRIRKFET